MTHWFLWRQRSALPANGSPDAKYVFSLPAAPAMGNNRSMSPLRHEAGAPPAVAAAKLSTRLNDAAAADIRDAPELSGRHCAYARAWLYRRMAAEDQGGA
jgi:hypothetical protein